MCGLEDYDSSIKHKPSGVVSHACCNVDVGMSLPLLMEVGFPGPTTLQSVCCIVTVVGRGRFKSCPG